MNADVPRDLLPAGDYPVREISKTSTGNTILEITDGPHKGRNIFVPTFMMPEMTLVATVVTEETGGKVWNKTTLVQGGILT